MYNESLRSESHHRSSTPQLRQQHRIPQRPPRPASSKASAPQSSESYSHSASAARLSSATRPERPERVLVRERHEQRGSMSDDSVSHPHRPPIPAPRPTRNTTLRALYAQSSRVSREASSVPLRTRPRSAAGERTSSRVYSIHSGYEYAARSRPFARSIREQKASERLAEDETYLKTHFPESQEADESQSNLTLQEQESTIKKCKQQKAQHKSSDGKPASQCHSQQKQHTSHGGSQPQDTTRSGASEGRVSPCLEEEEEDVVGDEHEVGERRDVRRRQSLFLAQELQRKRSSQRSMSE